jgi:HlyD family secretion protein
VRSSIIFACGLLVGVVGWYGYHWATGDGAPSGAPDGGGGPSVDGEKVVALGKIQPADGVLAVSAVPGSQIASLLVQENEQAPAGAQLATLVSLEMQQAQVGSIKAKMQEAEARLAAETAVAAANQAKAKIAQEKAESSGLDLEAQQAQVDLLQATVAAAERQAGRLDGASTDLVSAQQQDTTQLSLAEQRAKLKVAEVTLAKMQQSAEFAKTAAAADLAAAEAAAAQVKASFPLDSLKQQLVMAELQRDRSMLKAPIAGTVLKTFVQPGETVGNSPVLQMADLSRMVVVAEVYQNDIKKLKPGQKVIVESRAFHAPFDEQGLRGEIVRIGRQTAGAGLKSMDPFAKTDRDVLEVSIALDEASSQEAAKFVNLQVDVVIPLDE